MFLKPFERQIAKVEEVKGTVALDFRPTVFSTRSTHLDPRFIPYHLSVFCFNFVDFLNLKLDSPLQHAAGSKKT
jgi:hypothetical protein